MISFLALVIGAWKLPEPKSMLLLWAGLLLVGSLIGRMAEYVPVRTAAARALLRRYLGFRQYLADPALLSVEVSSSQFVEFLPYAWTLEVVGPWAARFANRPFAAPKWYFSDQPLTSTVDFATELERLIDYVAEAFVHVRERSI